MYKKYTIAPYQTQPILSNCLVSKIKYLQLKMYFVYIESPFRSLKYSPTVSRVHKSPYKRTSFCNLLFNFNRFNKNSCPTVNSPLLRSTANFRCIQEYYRISHQRTKAVESCYLLLRQDTYDLYVLVILQHLLSLYPNLLSVLLQTIQQ